MVNRDWYGSAWRSRTCSAVAGSPSTLQTDLPAMHPIFVPPGAAAGPVRCVTPATWAYIRAGLDAPARAFADAAGFEPRAGRHLLMPAPDGGLARRPFRVGAGHLPAAR